MPPPTRPLNVGIHRGEPCRFECVPRTLFAVHEGVTHEEKLCFRHGYGLSFRNSVKLRIVLNSSTHFMLGHET